MPDGSTAQITLKSKVIVVPVNLVSYPILLFIPLNTRNATRKRIRGLIINLPF